MKKRILILGSALISTLMFGQNASTTTFGGSADMYYKYDFSNKQGNGQTSFTRTHDSFELGMASINATHKTGKASVFVDLGFGKRASEFSYNDEANTFMIKQLNITYDLFNNLKITAGSFATHFGYEVVDAIGNKNYSMSYAFTNGPFFNTGVKAQYTLGKFSIMAGATNPTDFKSAIDGGTTQKTIIGQLGYVTTKGNVYFNFTSGRTNLTSSTTDNTQFDVVASRKVSEKLGLGVNGTYGIVKNVMASDTKKWFAAVGYANYAISPKTSLTYRLEYFNDKDAVKLNVLDNNIWANTLSLNYKEGNFTFIPEVRLDNASKSIFEAGTKNSNAYVLIATTYSF